MLFLLKRIRTNVVSFFKGIQMNDCMDTLILGLRIWFSWFLLPNNSFISREMPWRSTDIKYFKYIKTLSTWEFQSLGSENTQVQSGVWGLWGRCPPKNQGGSFEQRSDCSAGPREMGLRSTECLVLIQIYPPGPTHDHVACCFHLWQRESNGKGCREPREEGTRVTDTSKAGRAMDMNTFEHRSKSIQNKTIPGGWKVQSLIQAFPSSVPFIHCDYGRRNRLRAHIQNISTTCSAVISQGDGRREKDRMRIPIQITPHFGASFSHLYNERYPILIFYGAVNTLRGSPVSDV